MTDPVQKNPTPMERLALAVTPGWTRESGARLKTARMALLIEQEELGRLLGLSQRTISLIETGHRDVVKTLTLARLQAVLGKHTGFVLIGSNADAYISPSIRIKYWEKFRPGPNRQ